jgi:hypothetical protein
LISRAPSRSRVSASTSSQLDLSSIYLENTPFNKPTHHLIFSPFSLLSPLNTRPHTPLPINLPKMAPKSKKRQSSARDDYDSDGGFIAHDSGDDRRAKKAKTTKHTKTATSTATSSKAKPPASSYNNKKTTAPTKGGQASGDATLAKVDSNGDPYWELSRLRRVTVSSFKGRTLVNVREYYESGGNELPGKKVGYLYTFSFFYSGSPVFRLL